jgi:hypothetical protein
MSEFSIPTNGGWLETRFLRLTFKVRVNSIKLARSYYPRGYCRTISILFKVGLSANSYNEFALQHLIIVMALDIKGTTQP